jgi:hypothetical protein
MWILTKIKQFFTGLFLSIEYAQMKRAEAARKYFSDRWY